MQFKCKQSFTEFLKRSKLIMEDQFQYFVIIKTPSSVQKCQSKLNTAYFGTIIFVPPRIMRKWSVLKKLIEVKRQAWYFGGKKTNDFQRSFGDTFSLGVFFTVASLLPYDP